MLAVTIDNFPPTLHAKLQEEAKHNYCSVTEQILMVLEQYVTTHHPSAMKMKILIQPAVEGGFWVEVPALRGCVSEGDTLEEALFNVRDAITGWLEVASEQASPDTKAQVVEIQL